MAGLRQRVEHLVARLVPLAVERGGDEQAIVAVARRVGQPLAFHGDDPASVLARGLGQQLLDPGAEPVQPGRGDQRCLVAPGAGRQPEQQADPDPRVAESGRLGTAGGRHGARAGQQQPHVEADERGRRESEVREGGIPPPDARLAVEHRPEAPFRRQAVERRARVGHRGEPRAGRLAAGALPDALEEVRVQQARLERRARLAGDHEQGSVEVQGRLERPDPGRIRRIEHPQIEPAGRPEDPLQHLRTKARPAHAEQRHRDEAVPPHLRHERFQPPRFGTVRVRNVQPAEPASLVAAGPDGRVPLPEPSETPGRRPRGRLPFHRRAQRRRRGELSRPVRPGPVRSLAFVPAWTMPVRDVVRPLSESRSGHPPPPRMRRCRSAVSRSRPSPTATR